MSKRTHQVNESKDKGVFETPGGRSYLENLQRLHPTETTKRAIEKVQQDDAERDKK